MFLVRMESAKFALYSANPSVYAEGITQEPFRRACNRVTI